VGIEQSLTLEDIDREISVEQAVEILEPIPSQQQIVYRYRGWRSKVGRLRNDLKQAEAELALSESAVIRAALEHSS
jgi:allophanate hydrolase subunit 1